MRVQVAFRNDACLDWLHATNTSFRFHCEFMACNERKPGRRAAMPAFAEQSAIAAPLLPGGRLVVGRRIAVMGRVIAGWIAGGRRRTRCGTNGDTRRCTDRDTRPDAITVAWRDDCRVTIHRAAARGGGAISGSAIRAARGSAAIGTA